MNLVSIVIVNWNAGALLEACVRSALAASKTPVEVIVVDNASSDGSDVLVASIPGVRVIRNTANAGFAKACNQGASAASGEFLLFLNPDCEMTDDAVSFCVEAMNADPKIGACGVSLVNREGVVSRTCQRFPDMMTLFGILSGIGRVVPLVPRSHFMSGWPHDEDRDVDNVIGAFYFMRRSVFDELHGFDERFFVYWEDVDLSKRVVASGRRVRYLRGVSVYHLGGGTTENVRAFRSYLSTRGRILYAFKHLSAPQAWLHLGLSLSVEPLARATDRLLNVRLREVGEVLQAARLLYANLPQILRAARNRPA